MVLADGRRLRNSVRGAGRRKDQVFHFGAHACREQIQPAGDVGAVILFRVFDRFSDQRCAGHVDNAAETVLLKERFDGVLVLQVGLVDLEISGCGHRFQVAAGEIVEHHDGVAQLRECPHDVAADITGAAGHQHFRISSIFRCRHFFCRRRAENDDEGAEAGCQNRNCKG